jgi:hypothetical protein
MIYSFLFGIGQILIGSTPLGICFIVAGFVFGGVIFYQMNKRGWEILSN